MFGIRMIGILGSGQLSMMLSEAARNLGLPVSILAQKRSDPAVSCATKVELGSWENPDQLKSFVSGKSDVLFENEFVPEASFRSAGIPLDSPVFHPEVSVLIELQDKWKQKLLLNHLGIPTAQAILVNLSDDPNRSDQFHDQVLKWNRLGYDGKGTFLKTHDPAATLDFLEKAKTLGVQVYAENRVSFKRELAMVYYQDQLGTFGHFPLVQTIQKNGICYEVLSLSQSDQKLLQPRALLAGQKLGRHFGKQLTGVFAIEFFETQEGELLVNEIAPRVHNSGHFSQDACTFSQFEAHIRCTVQGQQSLKVSERVATIAPYFGMLNLISDVSGPSKWPEHEESSTGIRVHWYQKAENRPGRKMGHINYFSDDPKNFEKLRIQAKKIETLWKSG